MYRIKDMHTKKYIANIYGLVSYNNMFSSSTSRVHVRLHLDLIGEVVKRYNDALNYLKRLKEEELGRRERSDQVWPEFHKRFKLVECEVIEGVAKKKEATCYRIKDKKTGKFSIGRRQFNDVGKIYNSESDAQIALSRLSKAKKERRQTKAGKVLFMSQVYVDCEIVPCHYKDIRTIKI